MSELAKALAETHEVLRRQWAKDPGEAEPVYRYVVEFACTPSTFDRIKGYIAEQDATGRSFRFYPLGVERREPDG